MTGAELAELLVPQIGLVLENPLATSAGELPAGHLIGVRYRAGLGGVDIYAGTLPEPVASMAGPSDLARHGVRLPTAADEVRALTAARAAGELEADGHAAELEAIETGSAAGVGRLLAAVAVHAR